MTHPTDAVHIPAQTDDGGIFLPQEQRLEIAALLRELLFELGHATEHCELWLEDATLPDRARAMAEQLEGKS